MAYKTILVHCNDKRRVERIVGGAVELAERFQAHLIALSVSPPVLVVPTGMPGTPDTMVVDERCQAYRRDNPAMKAAFEAAVKERSFTSEWREEDAGSSSVGDVVIKHARAVRSHRCRSARPTLVWLGPARCRRIGWPSKPGARF